jgi:hypothetical protein
MGGRSEYGKMCRELTMRKEMGSTATRARRNVSCVDSSPNRDPIPAYVRIAGHTKG